MSKSRKGRYEGMHRLFGWQAVILFIVAIVGGLMGGVSAPALFVRASLVFVAVLVLGRVIIRVITTFEEV